VIPSETYSIGVDIGGTFTDCAVLARDGRCWDGKVATTPGDLATGFFDSIADAAQAMGLSTRELLSHTHRLAHGTTTGINTLVTRTGARVGLQAIPGREAAFGVGEARAPWRVQGSRPRDRG
jgi:N-methylhydantoinase A